MFSQILATKLNIPSPRPQLIGRQRLLDQLNPGLHGKLTVVSAPAGFGKTTLISAWIQTIERPVAWLSLEKEDDTPSRFMAYFLAALQTIRPEIGANLTAQLQSTPSPPLKAILTQLLNTIAAQPEPLLLVLDDYHVLNEHAIHDALAFLLDHLPPQMHLVMTTREDPPLPLARLRVRGQMTEIRAADLRFTSEEAAEFLNPMMGLSLSETQIAALEQRTEGWIAGLQLAALSIKGQPKTTEFIDSFTGSHRFVLDYLVEEVLAQQPQEIQVFLLQTAILQRLCGPLCDAVIQAADSTSTDTLERLEQANLFLIPLDHERRWYRYHHLFADLLRQRLQQTMGETQLNHLHEQASLWFEKEGLLLEAFQHAAAAGDVERAESLVAGDGMPLYYRGIVAPILAWLASLSEKVMDNRPSLWVLYASLIAMAGQNSQVEPLLKTAERHLQTAEPTGKTRDLIGQIAALRARLAGPRYDSEEILKQSQIALSHLDPDNLPIRTTVIRTMGSAYQYQGNLTAARDAYTEAIQLSEGSGNTHINMLASTGLGIIQESETQLHLAAEQYRRVLALAGEPPLPAACAAYLGLARIVYEWNELDTAEQHSQQAHTLSQHYDNIALAANCELLLATIQLARRDLPEAARLLADAEQFLRQNNFTDRLPQVAAVQIRLLLQQGEGGADAAVRLATEHQLPLSHAQALLAHGDGEAALAILESAGTDMTERDEQLRLVILFALAHAAAGDLDQATTYLTKALEQTQPEQFVRLYVDEGEPMRELLLAVRPQLLLRQSYIDRLLKAFDEPTPADFFTTPSQQLLVEPLTERELEVLHLLAEGLSNREIGQRLYLSLSTIKGHNSNIYGKLQVSRRTEAIVRARELGLL